jgi:two-component system chemotaxis response regulator CheY
VAVDVLIVDDSAAIRKILQRMLGQAGLTLGKVIEAGDGVEALAALKGKTLQKRLTLAAEDWRLG